MKLNKELLKKKVKEQLAMRNQTLSDEQIEACMDEVQDMHDQTAPFSPEGQPRLQVMTPAFFAGVQFCLDNCVRGKMDMMVSTEDSGKNWKVNKLKTEEQ